MSWPNNSCSVAPMPDEQLSTLAERFELCQPQVWGAAKNVVAVKHLYISSQPDAVSLDIAVEKGVETVINLRNPEEFSWDEKKAVHQAGLNYYNIPLSSSDESFDPVAINQISALIQAHHDQKILVHCSSGNRASAWLAIHLATDHNIPSDSAIRLAKHAGMTSPIIEARVARYLQDTVRR